MKFMLITLALLVNLITYVYTVCDTIHCKGIILETIQKRKIFDDGKYFVDMATKYPIDQITTSFKDLDYNISNEEIKVWVNENFYPPGYELEKVRPLDWKKEPAVLKKQTNEEMIELVSAVNDKWISLTAQFNSTKLPEYSISSFISIPYPFILPGGRFIEFYYWDSYWILEGLLASDMKETSYGFIQNLLIMVDKNRFMPNGARTYFTNRSQPPLLIQMLKTYHAKTKDDKLIFNSLSILDQEYDYWMAERSVRVNVANKACHLNYYNVKNDYPRPEVLVKDIEESVNMSLTDKKYYYRNVASAAESGWDFSIRWSNLERIVQQERELSVMREIGITHVLPVDLNSIMYHNERTLQRFYCKWIRQRAKFHSRCYWYGKAARRRFHAMRKLMYNDVDEYWSDYNFTSHVRTGDFKVRVNKKYELDKNGEKWVRPIFLSDLSSLWYMKEDWRNEDVRKSENIAIAKEEDEISQEIQIINNALLEQITQNIEDILDNYEYEIYDMNDLNEIQELLLKKGGIAISNIRSGQQWDYPNSWAPYQMYIVEALLDAYKVNKDQKFKRLALYLSKNWLQATYCGYQRNGTFFEKYNVEKVGEAGQGGEYTVQDGFGWTNGVILKLANEFGPEIELSSECNRN